jgi:phage baseplate assembly protein gpV
LANENPTKLPPQAGKSPMMSPRASGTRDYEITFTYQSGGQRLEIEWGALTVNGNEIMRDTHLAWAGDPVKDNTFKLNPGAMVFNGKYEIRAKVKTAGGNNSNGIITLRKK